ncbi:MULTISPECIES: hypothetical protein [Halomonadaceae]|jgi:hypothetical protein|uniref:Uncharacterized protein n=4 Tax=Vreelandella TaxID=3137766 RepID=A0A433KHL8_9GAMM|nr:MULTISPECIES: hypothetical protein [Halomonas]AJY52963.1 hypothetical protein KO116_P100208 [Halomonas sp. KO116]NVF16479.1 hypothetical protein [Halomonas maris]RUR28575.1 hypothetical protein ELY38_16725 [Halomonas nanhaiensis]|tara:strand:- start:1494 stop:1763 length:270 start_codon:yes stop_codon:yes gene_type:complete
MGITASPLVFANNSIELNKDCSAGHAVIVKPQSQTSLRTDAFTKNDLLYDKGNRQSDQRFMEKITGSSSNVVSYKPEDLFHDVGDGIRW